MQNSLPILPVLLYVHVYAHLHVHPHAHGGCRLYDSCWPGFLVVMRFPSCPRQWVRYKVFTMDLPEFMWCNVVSKFWYTADCGPHVAQITGKLWQWLSGSTPRPKRAANGLLAVPWCRELKNAVPDQQLVQGLFRNTFWANLGQFGCSGSLFGVFLCVPEQFHRYKANFAYHTA